MSTREKNTHERMVYAGSLAEGTFEQVAPHPWLRTGFDRPSWSDGRKLNQKLPAQLAAMADYLMDGPDGPIWVEAIGCKGRNVNSIKVHKLRRLREWQKFTKIPSYLFIYNSGREHWIIIKVDSAFYMTRNRDKGRFHDGPEYWKFTYDELAEKAVWAGDA